MYLFASLLAALLAGFLIGLCAGFSLQALLFVMVVGFLLGGLGNRMQMIADIKRIAKRIENER